VQGRERPFVDLYHQFTYNYPFEDYAASDWRERDVGLMEQYAKLSAPPKPQSSFEGEAFVLPSFVREHASGASLELLRRAPLLNRIAFLLGFVFGKTGDVPSRFLTCVRRTSPSGGARHPTDALVEIRNIDGGPKDGFYFYDPGNHTLVATARPHAEQLAHSGAVISLVSTVERAMWRYRDVRSYRPVLIDVGHIAEMIRLVAQALDLSAEFRCPPVHETTEIEWLDRPDYVDVVLGPAGSCWELRATQAVPAYALPKTVRGALVVNPFVCFKRSRSHLSAHAAWPKPADLEVTSADFRFFNHCLPSERGDRDSSMDGLLRVFPDARSRIKSLLDHGILIPEELARPAYRTARRWSRYGWYLSLLACLEARGGHDGRTPGIWNPPGRMVMDEDTLWRLLERKTCRAFSSQSMPLHVLQDIVKTIAEQETLEIAVAAFSVQGLSNGIYRWAGGKLALAVPGISRADVAKATIGQQPASAGSVAIWLLMPLGDDDTAADYESKIIAIGRAAHRACVVAHDQGLGTFMTPALYEADTLEMMEFDLDARRVIPYLLAMGYPA
jgi:SagB-type dehydrogenase family enzyme